MGRGRGTCCGEAWAGRSQGAESEVVQRDRIGRLEINRGDVFFKYGCGAVDLRLSQEDGQLGARAWGLRGTFLTP